MLPQAALRQSTGASRRRLLQRLFPQHDPILPFDMKKPHNTMAASPASRLSTDKGETGIDTTNAISMHFFNRFLFNDFKSFNPLFKVLFIFPSQYLFAIGFP
jgi:hypothetical protein